MLVEKNLPASARNPRDMGSIPESGRSAGGGNGTPLQYSCLENPMDRGAWWAAVHRTITSQTRLSHQAHIVTNVLFFFFSCLAPVFYLGSAGINKGLSMFPCLMYLCCSLWGHLYKKCFISKAWVEICITLHGPGHIVFGSKETVGKRRDLCWVLD